MKFGVLKQTDDRFLARVTPSRRVNQQATKFWGCCALNPGIVAKRDEVIGPGHGDENALRPLALRGTTGRDQTQNSALGGFREAEDRGGALTSAILRFQACKFRVGGRPSPEV